MEYLDPNSGTIYTDPASDIQIALNLIPLPPRPSTWHTWDGTTWIEQVDAKTAYEKLEVNRPILMELAALDTKKIRAIEDALVYNDLTKLQELSAQSATLRSKLI